MVLEGIFRAKRMKEAPLQKNQPFIANWRGDKRTFNALMTPHKSFENWLGSKRLRSSPILDEFIWSHWSITLLISPRQFALTGVFLASEHFRLVLSWYANLSHNITTLVFVTSSLFFSSKAKTKHFQLPVWIVPPHSRHQLHVAIINEQSLAYKSVCMSFTITHTFQCSYGVRGTFRHIVVTYIFLCLEPFQKYSTSSTCSNSHHVQCSWTFQIRNTSSF